MNYNERQWMHCGQPDCHKCNRKAPARCHCQSAYPVDMLRIYGKYHYLLPPSLPPPYVWNVPVLPAGVTNDRILQAQAISIRSSTIQIPIPLIVNFSIMPTARGCPALSPTIYPVTVNPLLPRGCRQLSGTSGRFNTTHAV